MKTTDNLKEFFTLVDENDNVTGKAMREECHTKGLWHRAVDIIIVNSKHEILLQKRSMTKDLYKGYWATSSAGHVTYEDTYEETTQRELKEEVGVSTKLERLFDFKKYTGKDNEIVHVFIGKHDGPFKPDRKEVEFVKFFTFDKINEMLKKEKFTPSTIEIFKRINNDETLRKRILSP